MNNKQFVFLISSIRSGSTLVKALLAEGGNVSHTPEINYPIEYGKPEEEVRENLGKLSDREIVVCKWTHDDGWKIPLKKQKVIFLVRDIYSTLVSMYSVYEYRVNAKDGEQRLNENPEEKKPPMGISEYRLAEWCFKTLERTYTRLIINFLSKDRHETAFLNFESLLNDPEIITSKLFNFIGSEKKEGVSSYSMPHDNYVWRWGIDDGGDNIKKMRVLSVQEAEDKISDAGKSAISEMLFDNEMSFHRLNDLIFEFKQNCHAVIST